MALCSIMSIRMLGLFMILPVFSATAQHMLGANLTLIGVTLGIYGLTQALFQIPFGMLSDRVGRKPVIFAGLCLFFIGSIIAALSHSIYFLLLGRALQGMGAIGSTVLALLADLTRDESRSKAMAFMGLSIGFAFTIAMIAGPIVNHWFHLSGIFWITAMLAMIGAALLFTIPAPPKPFKKTGASFLTILKNRELLRLDAGIFSLHAILTAIFIAIPIIFTSKMHLSSFQQISVYLCVLLLSFAFALPFIIIAEKKRKMKPVFIASIVAILMVQIGLYYFHLHIFTTLFLLFIFFIAFTVLEATLPSLVSKIAPIQNKGAAMGVYSSSQFFGIFVGGSVGGFILSHADLSGVFAFCAFISLIWLVVAFSMKKPAYLSTLVFPVDVVAQHDYQRLMTLPGVSEIAVVSMESLLYVKIDKEKISEYELRNAIGEGNLSIE